MGGSGCVLHPLVAFFKLEAPPQAEVTVQMACRHSEFVAFVSAGVDDSAEVHWQREAASFAHVAEGRRRHAKARTLRKAVRRASRGLAGYCRTRMVR